MDRLEADLPEPEVVYISRAALDYLKREVAEKEERVESKREVVGVEQDDEWYYHNEAARDGRRELAQAQDLVERLQRAILNARIVEPSQQTEVVMMGNKVTVKFLDSPNPDEFTILGEYDSRIDKSFISHQSPLAQAILGRKKGDVVSYPVGAEGRILTVEIKGIQPGSFS